MSLGIVIFARMDSRRLPGKSLADLADRPLLGRVIDRAKLVSDKAFVIVATSEREIDDPIAKFAADEQVSLFRGDAQDVLKRAGDCAEEFGLSQIARICGDSPFFSTQLVRQFIEELTRTSADIITNTLPRSFPEGASAEVMDVSAIQRAIKETNDPADREHITRYLYANTEKFEIHNHTAAVNYEGVKLAVDLPQDLEQARWIIENLSEAPEKAELDTIVALARQWTSLYETPNQTDEIL